MVSTDVFLYFILIIWFRISVCDYSMCKRYANDNMPRTHNLSGHFSWKLQWIVLYIYGTILECKSVGRGAFFQ